MQNKHSEKRKSIAERVADRKAEKQKRKSLNFSSFLVDVKHNPMILIGLIGSAFFTFLAGLFLGIAPHRAGDIITFFGGSNSTIAAVVGIFFGIVYAIAFPVLGEWGVYYWHKKASLCDEGNKTQQATAYTMLVLTAVFMVITAIFASTILASLLGAFKVYAEIPEAAQRWTVTIIPVGLALHAFANILYDHVSQAAAQRRELEHGLLTTELETEGRIREAKVKAKELAITSFADEYERISSREAGQVGLTNAKGAWEIDRIELGADHQDETPEAAKSPPSPPLVSNTPDETIPIPKNELPITSKKVWTLKMLEESGVSLAEIKAKNINRAWRLLKHRGSGITLQEFQPLYAQLVNKENP